MFRISFRIRKTKEGREKRLSNPEIIVSGFLGVVGASSLIYRLNGCVHGQEDQVMNRYQYLPQAEIIRPYDKNNNGILESNELENLMRDYSLSKRAK